MSNQALIIENLTKRYRIGMMKDRSDGWKNLAARFGSSFDYLASMLREPSESETIWALNGVSFQVNTGEVIGIIGRNGAGKSTLLKILSRITEPTGGRAVVHGRVGSLLEVGTGFHPELTGRENIYLNGAILGMKRSEIARKFDEIVAFSEVEKFLDTPVKRYSSGMYVRLAFAVAAHLEPDVLVVDEVLAVGDASFQKKCLGKMGDVAKEGRTVLFVSHNMVAVQNLCERAIWLDEGKIKHLGETKQIVSHYIQSVAHYSLERAWDELATAPGNDQVRFHKVRLIPTNHAPDKPITIDSELQLEVEIWNCIQDMTINFSVQLNTIEGVIVFSTISEARPRPEGIVRGVLQIPAHLLNTGSFSFSVMAVKDTSTSLFNLRDAIVFDVQETQRAGAWFGKWPGIVRPDFLWETEDEGRVTWQVQSG